MPHIYLTGFMGTGKTTVGQILAKNLRISFLDCDSLIEEESRKSITQIFAEEGEESFRDKETDLLRRLANQTTSFADTRTKMDSRLKHSGMTCVISTGGGLPKREENRQLMRKNGIIIHLSAEPKVIYERIKHETHRPLLQVTDPLKKITELLLDRAEAYADCHLSLPTDELSPEEIANALTAYLLEQGFRP